MATTRVNGERGATRAAEGARDLVSDARNLADEVAGAAGNFVNALPEAAASTRAAVDQAARRIEEGSDETLTIGTAFSLGLATGLLVGGGSRLLVLGALVPVAAMGLTLLDRSTRSRRPSRAAAS